MYVPTTSRYSTSVLDPAFVMRALHVWHPSPYHCVFYSENNDTAVLSTGTLYPPNECISLVLALMVLT